MKFAKFLPVALALIAAGLYASTRLFHLDDFPIFFFCDEAYIGAHISDLIRNGLRDEHGTLLPLYVEKDSRRWVPQISLYLYLVPVYVWGNTIVVLRATTALISLIGAGFLSAFLWRSCRVRQAWLAIAVLGALPVWMLHSRTAFETVLIIPFWSMALFFWGEWFNGKRYALVGLPLSCALLFYSHFSGSVTLVCSAVLTLLLCAPFVLRHIKGALIIAAVFLVLMIPFFTFAAKSPGAMAEQLTVIASPWYQEHTPTAEKASQAFSYYTSAFSLRYWFGVAVAEEDAARHWWGGRGYLEYWVLPFLLHGLLIAIRRSKELPYRLLLVSIPAAAAPALLVPLMIMRVFALLVPITCLIAISIDAIIGWVRNRTSQALAALTVALLLFGHQVILYRETKHAGTWFKDYGLYGLQWGAKEIFARFVPELRQREPEATVWVTASWANGAGIFPRFFLTPKEQAFVAITNPDELRPIKRQVPEKLILILNEVEYKSMARDPKFTLARIGTLARPDGRPGFIAVKFAYSPLADGIFAEEREERSRPSESTVSINGSPARVSHSKIEQESLEHIFDDDLESLVKTLTGVNPFIIDVTFDAPRTVSGVRAILWPMTLNWSISAYAGDGSECARGADTTRGRHPDDARVDFMFPNPCVAQRIRVELEEDGRGDDSRVHLRELEFLP